MSAARLTLSALKASDIPDPEEPGDETPVYRKRRGQLEEFLVSKGRERHNGRVYFCLRLVDGFRTYGTLSELKRALQA